MAKVWKYILCGINGISGFFTAYLLPVALIVALNMKYGPGGGNDPDGELFRPVGWFFLAMLVMCLLLLVGIGIWLVKKQRLKWQWQWIFPLCYMVGLAASVCVQYAGGQGVWLELFR